MSNSLKRSRKCTKKARSETYLRLLKNAGPIPKGIYKVIDRGSRGFICECGWKIIFGIEYIKEDSYQILRKKEVDSITSVEEFLVRYWSLMDEYSRRPYFLKIIPRVPKTFCILDPSLSYHA